MGRMSLTSPPGSNDATDDRLKEIALREREIQIKAEEVELQRSEAAKSSKFGPILIAIWTAAAAAAGNGVVSYMNGQQMHRLENEKAQSAIILEVVKTGSPDKAASNLAFLVEIGVISQEQAGARLRNYLQTRVAGQGPSTLGSTGDLSADAACTSTSVGDYVVVNVHWGDEDGGLNIRIGPNKTPVGVIPTTGIGIDVGTCSGGWCQVRYKCVNGWAFAQHLALRSTRLARFKDISDPKGLLVRRDPRTDGEAVGTLAASTTDVVKHVCQPAPLSTDPEWCQISVGKMSGWVPQKNLEDQPAAAPTSHVVSSTVADSVKPASATTPTATAPPPPQ
jgi:SH3-like domain-containing protein